MMKRSEKRNITISPWFSLCGLFGFLGLLPADANNSQYFFFIFFGFFAWFFWGKLMKEQADERMAENQKKAAQAMTTCFCLLAFFLLFALSKGISGSMVLLFGSLGYAACMILTPALVLYFDRVAG